MICRPVGLTGVLAWHRVQPADQRDRFRFAGAIPIHTQQESRTVAITNGFGGEGCRWQVRLQVIRRSQISNGTLALFRRKTGQPLKFVTEFVHDKLVTTRVLPQPTGPHRQWRDNRHRADHQGCSNDHFGQCCAVTLVVGSAHVREFANLGQDVNEMG